MTVVQKAVEVDLRLIVEISNRSLSRRISLVIKEKVANKCQIITRYKL